MKDCGFPTQVLTGRRTWPAGSCLQYLPCGLWLTLVWEWACAPRTGLPDRRAGHAGPGPVRVSWCPAASIGRGELGMGSLSRIRWQGCLLPSPRTSTSSCPRWARCESGSGTSCGDHLIDPTAAGATRPLHAEGLSVVLATNISGPERFRVATLQTAGLGSMALVAPARSAWPTPRRSHASVIRATSVPASRASRSAWTRASRCSQVPSADRTACPWPGAFGHIAPLNSRPDTEQDLVDHVVVINPPITTGPATRQEQRVRQGPSSSLDQPPTTLSADPRNRAKRPTPTPQNRRFKGARMNAACHVPGDNMPHRSTANPRFFRTRTSSADPGWPIALRAQHKHHSTAKSDESGIALISSPSLPHRGVWPA